MLRTRDSFDRLEAWTADQEWQAGPTGWLVRPDLQGWRFRIQAVAEGLRLIATAPSGGAPAVWIVTRGHEHE